MGNTLLMRTEASYSLNFLIYIQNIFINQNQSREQIKYPYIPSKCEFRKDFEMSFKEVWSQVSKRISEYPIHDQTIFYEKTIFYKSLFAENDQSLNVYNELYLSFKVWWGSFAGRFAIERSFDVYGQEIYTGLANRLMEKEMKPQRDLSISLLYDECLYVELKPAAYFAVLPIQDWLVNHKELIQKLALCFEEKGGGGLS
ncbi:hypothetical protein [Mesobacillus maritimus]|uniref:hypothetical protein n=1 Tax=Mesobacillus maritimus TaxID=1643336 RepID=UPI00384B7BE6